MAGSRKDGNKLQFRKYCFMAANCRSYLTAVYSSMLPVPSIVYRSIVVQWIKNCQECGKKRSRHNMRLIPRLLPGGTDESRGSLWPYPVSGTIIEPKISGIRSRIPTRSTVLFGPVVGGSFFPPPPPKLERNK